MQTKLYRKVQAANDDPIIEQIKANIAVMTDTRTQRRELAKRLKFLCQSLDCQIADLYYPRLTSEERQVWRKFLPGTYEVALDQDGKRILHTYGNWETYQFDLIPTEILEEIDFAISLGAFNWINILTPENTKFTDPIVIGILSQSHWYLIARWGESLLPYERIKFQVKHPILHKLLV